MDMATGVQILNETLCNLLSTNTLGKDINPPILPGPVGWCCRIHQLLLCRGVRLSL